MNQLNEIHPDCPCLATLQMEIKNVVAHLWLMLRNDPDPCVQMEGEEVVAAYRDRLLALPCVKDTSYPRYLLRDWGFCLARFILFIDKDIFLFSLTDQFTASTIKFQLL